MASSEASSFSGSTSGPSPETTDSLRNPVSDTDLDHSEGSFRKIVELLSGDIGGEVTEQDGETFSRESGDDQGVHDSDELETLVAFHLATSGIMSEETGLYQEAREEDLSLEETVQRVEDRQGYEPRNIMQGAYSTAKVISQLPRLVKRRPGAISAEHSSPVRHGDEIEVEREASEADIPLVKYDAESSEDEVYAEHEVLDEADENIDYELMAYALAKGMSFDDRNGDVLFGFPEVRFTGYERENLEELVMAERSLVEDPEQLEYAGEEVLAGAEKMESQFQGLIDEDVEVNIYNNVVEDQDGETVIEYAEMDLQGVEYPEAQDSTGDMTELFRASNELGIKTAELYGSWMKAGMQANPFIPTTAGSSR